MTLTIDRGQHRFILDHTSGRAALTPTAGGEPVWTGTLYPALHVQEHGQRSVLHATGTLDGDRVRLDFAGRVSGSAIVAETEYGAELVDLTIDLPEGVALVDLYFGLAPLTPDERSVVADPDYPEWPDFRSAAVCVPSARPAPPASILRRWDLGQATVPLGLYGPALGSPYGAAFPRPVYAAAFGDDRGWLVAGAGEVADAALTLELRGTSSALRWRYREDLWPVPAGTRTWAHPLRITWAATAVEAFADYFGTFVRDGADATEDAALATWNSWGDFRRQDFRLDELATTARDMGAGILVLDAGWETSESTGIADEAKLPDLARRLAAIQDSGMQIGFWQSVGWIDHPAEVGLSDDDLLVGLDGKPRRVNWAMDPRDMGAHFALDPSSPRTRVFLAERMRAIIRTYRPALIKLDFGYGMPGPDSAVPRDPALRGERLGHELYRIVRDAAKAEDPAVAIQLYGIHPLHAGLADVIALDDMGDHGDRAEAEGHRHWSVWAALLGKHGVVVNGSSGYHWDQDGDVVLDTAVLGSPGAVLPLLDPAQPVSRRALARRRALNRWHRRTVRWSPLWLDSQLGSVDAQPSVVSWGRVETPANVLTALCLRSESSGRLIGDSARGITHSGDWAVIAQGDTGLDAPRDVAVVPVSPGELRMPCGGAGVELVRWNDGVAIAEPPRVEHGAVVLAATADDLDGGLEGWSMTLR